MLGTKPQEWHNSINPRQAALCAVTTCWSPERKGGKMAVADRDQKSMGGQAHRHCGRVGRGHRHGRGAGPICAACSAILTCPRSGSRKVYIHFTKDLIDDGGNVSNNETRKFLQTIVDHYAGWVAKIA
jgi:hypothetical protein